MSIRRISLPHGSRTSNNPASKMLAVAAGRHIFETEACMNCHTIDGTAAKGTVGPDLTHLMSRATIAAGAALNTPQNLRAWIQDPNTLNPARSCPPCNSATSRSIRSLPISPRCTER